jgi:hypothetical protein
MRPHPVPTTAEREGNFMKRVEWINGLLFATVATLPGPVPAVDAARGVPGARADGGGIEAATLSNDVKGCPGAPTTTAYTLDGSHHLSIDYRALNGKRTIADFGNHTCRNPGDEGWGSAMDLAPWRRVVTTGPDSTDKYPTNGKHLRC